MVTIATGFAQGSPVRILSAMTVHTGKRRTGKLRIFMTAFTGRGGMTAQQRKRRQFVIKLHILMPARFPVTLLALHAQRLLVNVIATVTGNAGGVLDRIVHIALVALVATHTFMSTAQRKACLPMIKAVLAPAVLAMALAALLAILAKMHVVLPMTSRAGLGQRLGHGVRLVTGGALRRPVCAHQLEIRIAIVIEAHTRPLLDPVATIALRAKRVQVHVIDLVTADASDFRLSVIITAVTLTARYLAVRPLERELRLAMIEDSFAPTVCRVAVFALLSLTALVNIIFAVTIDTLP